ncbi:hypothetical protein [Marinicrinis sediminis]|uniref:IDEAL domain-containing protein n=1 Tax=Marinicrinis sediminis TaxID=1652465 RepID=A0ABW5RCI8_9BACL
MLELVVRSPFDHWISCMCSNCETRRLFHFEEGDRVTFTNKREYHEEQGWMMQVIVNEQYAMFIAMDDLQAYHQQKWMASQMDIELEMNYLTFKIDEALAQRSDDSFRQWSEQYRALQHLYQQLVV